MGRFSARHASSIVFALLPFLYQSPAQALDIAHYSPISVYTTDPKTPEVYLAPSQVTALSSLPSNAVVLSYNQDNVFQQIDGFGAALTDSTVYNLNKLSVMLRTKLLHMLFSADGGFNLNYLRVPIGATDFSLRVYSFLDLPSGQIDPNLAQFNASPADATIALLRDIRQINPDVRILLTPWSPPAWMKTNGSMMNGSLKPEMYDIYSHYLLKSIQAFENKGVPVSMITVQNEPFYGTNGYPSMAMTDEEQIQLINHFGPLLRDSGLSAQILGLDHNFIYRNDADHIYSETHPWLAGIAYHCYEGDTDDLMGSTEPIYQTECTAIADGTSFAEVLHSWLETEVIDGGLVGSKLALGWNLVLDENHGPYIGYCNNCRGMVDVNMKTQAVTVNPELIALAHASKFVFPGAYRMETQDFKSKDFSYIGYSNPDGSFILVVENKSEKVLPFVIPDLEGHYYQMQVPANGVSTVRILTHKLPAKEESDPYVS